ELEESVKQLRLEQENYLAELAKLEVESIASQLAQAEAAQAKRLAEEESKRKEMAEQRPSTATEQPDSDERKTTNPVRGFLKDKFKFLLGKRRQATEQETGETSQEGKVSEAQPIRNQPLQASLQPESSPAQQTALELRSQELQATQADVLERVK